MELFAAHQQWATRPADERFPNLQSMYDACLEYRRTARTATFDLADCSVGTDHHQKEVLLAGKTGTTCRLTHHAFGQLCSAVSAPASYLRTLPTQMVSDNLNHGIRHLDDRRESSMLLHKNGSLIARCLTSTIYHRIWNHEILERLLPLPSYGWSTPPAYSVNGSDNHGLYASDHDMFVFMVNEKKRIDDGTDGGLGRGFFVSNSEVGQAAFWVRMFYYRYVCGNHIVWGAQHVHEVRVIHKGQPAKDWDNTLMVKLRKYADESASDDEAKIVAAKRFKIGGNKTEVLDRLFGQRALQISRKDLDASYEYAKKDNDLYHGGTDPNTVWGMVQGLTTQSQTKVYADERVKLDRAAGKVLQMAF